MTGDELQATAGRIVTAKKLYNQREGWTPAEDTLPQRFLSEGLPASDGAQATLPRERLQAMIQAYYAARGWGDNGRVPRGVIASMHLTDLVSGETA